MRPKIAPGTPLEYKKLMEQCWDAIPSKRPDIVTLLDEIVKLDKLYYQNENEEQPTNNNINTQLNTSINTSSSSINSSLVRKFSKVHIFDGLPEPKNATEGRFIEI